MAEEETKEEGAAEEQELSLLDKIVTDGNMIRDESQMTYARDLIGELVTQILADEITVSADTAAMINERIAQIDQLVSDQLNEVMHEASFQKLEGSWRGLNYLVMNTETGVMLKLRLLNITQKELLNDLEKAVEALGETLQELKPVIQMDYPHLLR